MTPHQEKEIGRRVLQVFAYLGAFALYAIFGFEFVAITLLWYIAFIK